MTTKRRAGRRSPKFTMAWVIFRPTVQQTTDETRFVDYTDGACAWFRRRDALDAAVRCASHVEGSREGGWTWRELARRGWRVAQADV